MCVFYIVSEDVQPMRVIAANHQVANKFPHLFYLPVLKCVQDPATQA